MVKIKKMTLWSQVQLIWINIATKSFLKGLWRKDRSLRRVLKHSMNFLVRQECGAMSVRWLITYQNFGTRPDLVKNRKEEPSELDWTREQGEGYRLSLSNISIIRLFSPSMAKGEVLVYSDSV